MNIMDENYGLFVVTVNTKKDRVLLEHSHMKKFDSLDDFMSGSDRAKSELMLYTLRQYFNLLNNGFINVENSCSQVVQLKK